ncbi:MAG: DnaT-like ssDNA-binding domain-containing protein [Pseudomonadota bacterium]|nr:DnaT-like ssDNA-binding domain-containing protein [Pseudomonadota bacterium]
MQERSAGGESRASPIPPDWRPGERVVDWAAKQGMIREWVEAQIDEFVVYWSDTGERRKSWEATFINRLRTLQANVPKGQDHEAECRLADKDYRSGATPFDEIPWIRPAALG